MLSRISAMLMIVSLGIVEHAMKIDDPVGAESIHGRAGLWSLPVAHILGDGIYRNVSSQIEKNGPDHCTSHQHRHCRS